MPSVSSRYQYQYLCPSAITIITISAAPSPEPSLRIPPRSLAPHDLERSVTPISISLTQPSPAAAAAAVTTTTAPFALTPHASSPAARPRTNDVDPTPRFLFLTYASRAARLRLVPTTLY